MAGPVERRTIGLIFCAALALCALVTKPHVSSWNDGSRVATVDALTANHTFAIDGSPFAARLGDEFRFRGRTYSDKSPLLAVAAALEVSVVAPFGITLRLTPAIAIYLITLLTVGVAFAAGCCYVYAFERLLGVQRRLAVAVAALGGIATLALPYATVLANHVPCGAAVLAGFYHLFHARVRPGGRGHVVLAGLLFALAYAFDPAGIVFWLGAAIMLWGAPARRWFLAAAAAAPIVALQLAYNLMVTGSIVPPAFNANVWRDPSLLVHTAAPQIVALYAPSAYLGFIVNLLVGTKGLVSFTPLVLVAGYGLVLLWRTPGPERRLAQAIVVTSAAFFLTIVLFQNDSDARNFGERRYVDAFFLWSVALGPAFARLRTPLAIAFVRVAIVWSVATAALGTVAPFGGAAGESGFSYGGAAFLALLRRAPVQGALDVVLAIVVLVVILRLTPLGGPPAARAQATVRIS